MSEKHCSQKKLRKRDHFHILATVNSTAMNTGVHASFELGFSRGICPEMGLLGHIVLQCLGF